MGGRSPRWRVGIAALLVALLGILPATLALTRVADATASGAEPVLSAVTDPIDDVAVAAPRPAEIRARLLPVPHDTVLWAVLTVALGALALASWRRSGELALERRLRWATDPSPSRAPPPLTVH